MSTYDLELHDTADGSRRRVARRRARSHERTRARGAPRRSSRGRRAPRGRHQPRRLPRQRRAPRLLQARQATRRPRPGAPDGPARSRVTHARHRRDEGRRARRGVARRSRAATTPAELRPRFSHPPPDGYPLSAPALRRPTGAKGATHGYQPRLRPDRDPRCRADDTWSERASAWGSSAGFSSASSPV